MSEENKTAVIKVLASPAEREAFRECAVAEGVKVSTWLRLLGRKAAGLGK